MLPNDQQLCTFSTRLHLQLMDDNKPNVFLVGPMGSGKTTIGRLVADKLGLAFHDCDHELEQLTGASVNLIFDVEGEAGFRERESQMLQRISALQGVLVSTGGGVVTRPENRTLLKNRGLVVWLKTTVDQQLKRLSHDKSRPLLQTPDRKQKLERLAEERNPLYQELADLVFISPDRNSHIAARDLARRILDHRQFQSKGKFHACN